jgi:hypothetical protein
MPRSVSLELVMVCVARVFKRLIRSPDPGSARLLQRVRVHRDRSPAVSSTARRAAPTPTIFQTERGTTRLEA